MLLGMKVSPVLAMDKFLQQSQVEPGQSREASLVSPQGIFFWFLRKYLENLKSQPLSQITPNVDSSLRELLTQRKPQSSLHASTRQLLTGL